MEPSASNPAAIEFLRKLGGNAFAVKMIDLFLSYVGGKIAGLRQCQQAGDLAGVVAAAHPIKSSAGNVGAVRVMELATLIEQMGSKAQADGLAAHVDELERAFAEASEFLKSEKIKLQPEPA